MATANIQQVIDSANKKMDAMLKFEQQAHEKKQAGKGYMHREKIPESYLWMADLYHELTGQEPTKQTLMDWLSTFEEWKQSGLTAESLRGAYAKSKDANGFFVGRPGALTITARGVKSADLAKPEINEKAIEAAKEQMTEKWDQQTFIPRPAYIERPKNIPPSRKARRHVHA
jgi:hypothetical protein